MEIMRYYIPQNNPFAHCEHVIEFIDHFASVLSHYTATCDTHSFLLLVLLIGIELHDCIKKFY